jgi:hypothetical protein
MNTVAYYLSLFLCIVFNVKVLEDCNNWLRVFIYATILCVCEVIVLVVVFSKS